MFIITNITLFLGSIVLDGVPIDQVDVAWLRDRIGFVQQEPFLFNTTIRENITYGTKEATDVEIMIAAEQANAAQFIASLPEGLDTMCGTGGSKLSGKLEKLLFIPSNEFQVVKNSD